MTRLAGAHVLITGASRGIGKHLAYELAARGARLTLVARDGAALGAVATETGGRYVTADFADDDTYTDLVESVERRGGPLDVLINNAGAVHAESMLRQSSVDLRRAVEVNLLAPMELTRQAISQMSRRGCGHIVNVGSIGAVAVFPGLVPYAAAKAGLAHFSAGLRVDLRGRGIKVTHVDVGPVMTDALQSAKSHGPADASYRRAYRLRLLVDLNPDLVARQIVTAIEQDRRVVRLPRRTAPLGLLVELPRRAVEALLVGIPRTAGT